jgi:hypothetical protein
VISPLIGSGTWSSRASVLTEPGVPLIDLLGQRGVARVDDMHGTPPVDGWRVIDGALPADPAVDVSATIAAPGAPGLQRLDDAVRDPTCRAVAGHAWHGWAAARAIRLAERAVACSG